MTRVCLSVHRGGSGPAGRGGGSGPAGGGGSGPARGGGGSGPAGGVRSSWGGQVQLGGSGPAGGRGQVQPGGVGQVQPGGVRSSRGGSAKIGQHREYLLHGGQYASCVHAGGPSCYSSIGHRILTELRKNFLTDNYHKTTYAQSELIDLPAGYNEYA